MNSLYALPMTEASQVGDARRTAAALATRLGFDDTRRGEIAIVVTEVANNLVRHAQQGELIIRGQEVEQTIGLELLALDKGPGIENIALCFQDGYSTGGTAGGGMGAIARLADTYDIHSVPGVGTALLARFWTGPIERPARARPLTGAICLPKPGQEVSGDSWAEAQDSDRCLLLVADGLGHGPEAARASQEAVRIFHDNQDRGPKEILEAAHAALRGTRGAAAAVIELNRERREARFAGIGNIAASIHFDGRVQNLVSHNGIVGHQMRTVQEFLYAWPPQSLVMLHSDGLMTQWRLDRYPGLLSRSAGLIAGVLYRDYKRGTDDVTIVVIGETERP